MKEKWWWMLAVGALLALGRPVAAADPVMLDFSSREQPDLHLQVGQSQLITSPVPLEQAVMRLMSRKLTVE